MDCLWPVANYNAGVLCLQQDYLEAIKFLRAAMEHYERLYPKSSASPALAMKYYTLGKLLLYLKDKGGAQESLRQAARRFSLVYPSSSRLLENIQHLLKELDCATG